MSVHTFKVVAFLLFSHRSTRSYSLGKHTKFQSLLVASLQVNYHGGDLSLAMVKQLIFHIDLTTRFVILQYDKMQHALMEYEFFSIGLKII